MFTLVGNCEQADAESGLGSAVKTRTAHARNRLQWLVAAALVLISTVAMAAEEATAKKKSSPLKGFGGTLIYDNTLGKGTFTGSGDGYSSRPLWTMWWSIRPKYTFIDEVALAISLRFDITKTVIDNADSGNSRNRQTVFGDIWLNFGAGKLQVKSANLTFTAGTTLFLPTSLESRAQSKILGLRFSGSVNYEPVKWFSMLYAFSFTKNFNRFTNTVVDNSDLDIAQVSRSGGAESIGGGLVATGSGITEWGLIHDLHFEFSWLEKFSIGLDYIYLQNFSYNNFAKNDQSSPYATGGRGYSDTSWTIVDFTYQVLPYLGLSLGWMVIQEPKSADNKSVRFPFWDFSNGASNRQTFYLDVTASF